MRVTDSYIQITNKLIELVESRKIRMENGNVLIAKPEIEETTAGGLVIPSAALEREKYATGFGRVISLPRNLRPVGADGFALDADLKVGDYILYSHSTHYRPLPAAVRLMLGVADFPDHFIYIVTDPEVMSTVPKEIVHQEETTKQ
jgi:co-chaperonin GroES (HSP10)